MPRLPFENRLPDTKSATHRGYKFSPSVDVAGGTLVYQCKRKQSRYWLEAIPADLPGRAFTCRKVVKPGEEPGVYDLLLSDRAGCDTCDCAGFTYGATCLHLDILRDLDAAGELPELLPLAEMDLVNPDADFGPTECDDWACEIESQYEDMYGDLIATTAR